MKRIDGFTKDEIVKQIEEHDKGISLIIRELISESMCKQIKEYFLKGYEAAGIGKIENSQYVFLVLRGVEYFPADIAFNPVPLENASLLGESHIFTDDLANFNVITELPEKEIYN